MIGVLASAIGMKVNADTMEINLSPVRYPCRIPITLLADWKEGYIPWFECRIDNGKIVWRLEGQPPIKWHINMDFGMLINQ